TTIRAERIALAGEIVLHPAIRLRLEQACSLVLRYRMNDAQLRMDVLQHTQLLLIERLTGGNLAYRHESIASFGGWLYSVCRSASVRAYRDCLAQCFPAMALIDPQRLEEVPCAPEGRTRRDCLLRAIDAIDDPLQRNVMLDEASGVSMRESSVRL